MTNKTVIYIFGDAEKPSDLIVLKNLKYIFKKQIHQILKTACISILHKTKKVYILTHYSSM